MCLGWAMGRLGGASAIRVAAPPCLRMASSSALARCRRSSWASPSIVQARLAARSSHAGVAGGVWVRSRSGQALVVAADQGGMRDLFSAVKCRVCKRRRQAGDPRLDETASQSDSWHDSSTREIEHSSGAAQASPSQKAENAVDISCPPGNVDGQALEDLPRARRHQTCDRRGRKRYLDGSWRNMGSRSRGQLRFSTAKSLMQVADPCSTASQQPCVPHDGRHSSWQRCKTTIAIPYVHAEQRQPARMALLKRPPTWTSTRAGRGAPGGGRAPHGEWSAGKAAPQ